MKSQETIITNLEELYESIPESAQHQKMLARVCLEDMKALRDSQAVPPWIILVDELVRYFGLAILTSAYIFRSYHTGKQTIEQSIKYATQCHLLLLNFLKTGEINLNTNHAGTGNIVASLDGKKLFETLQDVKRRKK